MWVVAACVLQIVGDQMSLTCAPIPGYFPSQGECHAFAEAETRARGLPPREGFLCLYLPTQEREA
jgi:hypothetical protein